jgi:hypothetical protein
MAAVLEEMSVPVAAQDAPEAVTAAPTGVLRLRGLPFAAGEADVTEFFRGFPLTSCFVCKRNGEWYSATGPPGAPLSPHRRWRRHSRRHSQRWRRHSR